MSAKAKNSYQTDKNFKAIIDGFNKANYNALLNGVPDGTSLVRVDGALRATLKEIVWTRVQIASLSLVGIEEGTDYKIRFVEVQIMEYLTKCCTVYNQ